MPDPDAPQPRVPLPDATLDLISVALAYFVASKPGATYVQIGAGDGYHGDKGVRDLLPLGKVRAVLVEPLPDSFAKLRDRYDAIPNVTTVQAAIAAVDGEMDIFRARADGRWAGSNSAPQWASFNRQHLLDHGVLDAEIEAVRVPAFTLATLLDREGLSSTDILKVDTEGFDAAIVDMALRLDPVPECVYFEHVNLSDDDIVATYETLRQNGYEFAHDLWNTLALHTRVMDSWRDVRD